MKNAFKAYDIRGIWNEDFNRNDVYRIGYFLPELMQCQTILVGKDIRLSSDEIFNALCEGITDAGADVHSLGLSTTPMVYFATGKGKYSASVQITASHNPAQYNGLKISRENALPVGFDSGLEKLLQLASSDQNTIPVCRKGKVIPIDFLSDYISFLKQFHEDYSTLKIAIDCSNGMATLIVKHLFGHEVRYLFDEPDGSFPNHEPNPLEQKNLIALIQTVTEHNCDVGVIFDGDADRVMFVDNLGRFVSPDLMIAVMAEYFPEVKNGAANILHDIRTSRSVSRIIQQTGSKTTMWKVGRAFAAPKLREIDGVFGGELAGHYYFRDFYYSDSGMLACLIALNMIARNKTQGLTFAQMIDQIQTLHNSGEINFKLSAKHQAMEAVKHHFKQQEKPLAIYDIDGYRVEFADWWFNIRMSNTEPYLRFIAETATKEKLNTVIEQTQQIISQFT